MSAVNNNSPFYAIDPDLGPEGGFAGLVEVASFEGRGFQGNSNKRAAGDGEAYSPSKRARLVNEDGINQDAWHAASPNASTQDGLPADPSLALFRKTSKPPTKKYTRPPTKTVFQSLKISTEEWVRLEAEAKAYMLDTKHPERQSCVGNRNNGPSNDTKIQLFKTVQNFLAGAIGGKYFGVSDEKELGSRWMYPRDEDRLIALLTPLMRRMVTNERQRQYARRTRQSGVKDGEGEQQDGTASDAVSLTGQSVTSPGQSRLDVTTAQEVQHKPFMAEDCIECVFLIHDAVAFRYIIPTLPSDITFADLRKQIDLQITSHESTRVLASDLQPGEGSTLDNTHGRALSEVALAAAAHLGPSCTLQAHGPNGLEHVGSDEAWKRIGIEVAQRPWMLGFLRVIVTVSGND